MQATTECCPFKDEAMNSEVLQARKLLSLSGKIVADLETLQGMSAYIQCGNVSEGLVVVGDNLRSRIHHNIAESNLLLTELAKTNPNE